MEENSKNTNSQYGGFIPKHGGYRNLLCFQKAEVIYDGTCYFTEHFLHKPDRTIDQMVQAARSGKQNIAEGNTYFMDTHLEDACMLTDSIDKAGFNNTYWNENSNFVTAFGNKTKQEMINLMGRLPTP